MNQRKKRELIVTALYARFMNGDYISEEITDDIKTVVLAIEERAQSLDALISDALENWTIDRLNYVDKMIIRLAVYEMCETDTPVEVIINEAIELTKKYCNLDDDKARKFNNRLLDKIKQQLGK